MQLTFAAGRQGGQQHEALDCQAGRRARDGTPRSFLAANKHVSDSSLRSAHANPRVGRAMTRRSHTASLDTLRGARQRTTNAKVTAAGPYRLLDFHATRKTSTKRRLSYKNQCHCSQRTSSVPRQRERIARAPVVNTRCRARAPHSSFASQQPQPPCDPRAAATSSR